MRKCFLPLLVILSIGFQSINAEIISFKNKYLNLLFDDVNYRFSLQRELIPSKEYSKDLLFFNIPPTSFILLKIDNVSYQLNEGKILKKPNISKEGILNFSSEIENITVETKFIFVNNANSGLEDSIRIEVTLSNIHNTSKVVGARYLIDTLFGENEIRPKFYLDGKNAIDYELLINRNNMISYIVSSSDINQVNNLYIHWDGEPSRIIFSNWRKLSIANWEVEPSPLLGYRFSETSSEDAAVALFFEDILLKPNQSIKLAVVLSTSQYLPSTQQTLASEKEPKKETIQTKPEDTNVKLVVITNYIFITNQIQATQTQEVILPKEISTTNIITNVIISTQLAEKTQNIYQPILQYEDSEIKKKILEIEKKLDKLTQDMELLFTQITNTKMQEEIKNDKNLEKDINNMKEMRNLMIRLTKTLDTLEERITIINKYIDIRKRFANKGIVVYSSEEYRKDIKLIDEISKLLDEIMDEIIFKR
ncbi:MAG: hypothetical protein N2712_03595 [Brevinematales bacterium]|nr:hypothetical protein [Brevinematales bacterium]